MKNKQSDILFYHKIYRRPGRPGIPSRPESPRKPGKVRPPKIETKYRIIISNYTRNEINFTYRFHQVHLSDQDVPVFQNFLQLPLFQENLKRTIKCYSINILNRSLPCRPVFPGMPGRPLSPRKPGYPSRPKKNSWITYITF